MKILEGMPGRRVCGLRTAGDYCLGILRKLSSGLGYLISFSGEFRKMLEWDGHFIDVRHELESLILAQNERWRQA